MYLHLQLCFCRGCLRLLLSLLPSILLEFLNTSLFTHRAPVRSCRWAWWGWRGRVCVCVCVSVCLFVCVCIYLLASRKWMKPCGSPTLLLIHPSRPPDGANACGALCWLHCPLPVVPLGCAVLMLTFVLQPLAHGLGQPGAPLPWQHPLLIVALYK